jgi:hypothetical protein
MTWQPGLGQSGYQVLAFLPTGPVTIPAGGLPAGATAFFDSRPFGGSVCYMLVPVAGASALGRSDFLCWLANTLTSVGAPQNFTMRLNESNTATFTWTGPLGGGQTSYVLVPFGGQPITLPGTATSATAPATPGTFACYALLALQGQSTMGFTNVHCGFAGLAQL